MGKSASRERDRKRDKRSRDREEKRKKADKKSASRSRSRNRSKKKSRSRSSEQKKKASRREPSRRRSRSRSRSRSRRPERRSRSRRRRPSRERRRSRSWSRRSRDRGGDRGARDRDRDRVPPSDLKDYESLNDQTGWYVYRKTGKWKFHPDMNIFLHVKSGVYYSPVSEGKDAKYRRIEGDDDPIMKKLKQWQDMQAAIKKTEFHNFDHERNREEEEEKKESLADTPLPGTKSAENTWTENAKTKVLDIPYETNKRLEGKVQKWDSERGFGFILPLNSKIVTSKDDEKGGGLFVHRRNIVGSTALRPLNLKEAVKVIYEIGEMDGRPCATEVRMLGKDGTANPIHEDNLKVEDKRKKYFVSMESLQLRSFGESWPGKRNNLHDRFANEKLMDELGVFFGIYDGHGGSAAIAEHCADRLHKHLLSQYRQKNVQPASRDEKIIQAHIAAFEQTDAEVCESAERKQLQLVGSTAVTLMVHGNPKLGSPLRLVIANCGDSRAILCREGKAVPLSEDHKPNRSDEKKRIERLGGAVLEIRGHMRVVASANPNARNKTLRREYQALAMTRSLGDLYFKQPTPLSVPTPEVTLITLTPKDFFCVLATDGILDVMSNQDIIDTAALHWSDPSEAAKSIVRKAFNAGSEDNLTALVVQFGWTDGVAENTLAVAGKVAKGTEIDEDQPGPRAAAVEDDGFDMFG